MIRIRDVLERLSGGLWSMLPTVSGRHETAVRDFSAVEIAFDRSLVAADQSPHYQSSVGIPMRAFGDLAAFVDDMIVTEDGSMEVKAVLLEQVDVGHEVVDAFRSIAVAHGFTCRTRQIKECGLESWGRLGLVNRGKLV